MIRDPPRNPDADGRDLFRADPYPTKLPGTGTRLSPFAHYIKIRKESNACLFQFLKIQRQVSPHPFKVKDRISDQLSRGMQRHIPASVNRCYDNPS